MDYMPLFGRFRRLKDLAPKLNRDDVVSIAMDDELWEREMRQSIDQAELRTKQPVHRQPAVMKLGHSLDRRERRLEDERSGGLLCG